MVVGQAIKARMQLSTISTEAKHTVQNSRMIVKAPAHCVATQ